MGNIMIKKDDIDRIVKKHGSAGPLQGYWMALNRIASIYGNPFTAAYSILRVESYLADRQISACNKKLEALKMLLVVRDKGTKNPNTYKLLTGAYSEQ